MKTLEQKLDEQIATNQVHIDATNNYLASLEREGTGSPASGAAALIFLPILMAGFLSSWLGLI